MDMKRFFLYFIAIAALALAGCGGNGGKGPGMPADLITCGDNTTLVGTVCMGTGITAGMADDTAKLRAPAIAKPRNRR